MMVLKKPASELIELKESGQIDQFEDSFKEATFQSQSFSFLSIWP